MPTTTKAKLLLVAWPCTDWSQLHPLLDSGELPALRNLVQEGVSGTLRASFPMIAPILWTTAATGRTPDTHGVLTGFELDPVSGRHVPPSSTTRQVPALWNLLERAGLRSQVIGWPATHPAEAISGTIVSDRFARPTARQGAPWPALPAAVFPPEVERPLLELRLHPGEISGVDLLPFVPRLAAIDQKADRRLVPLAAALAETVTFPGAATWCLEHRPWDFAAVYYPLSAAAAQWYMRYTHPRLPSVEERDVDLYGGVVRASLQFQDAMLARLLAIAGPETTVMVISEHGFLSGVDRPPPVGAHQADFWPRPRGILVMHGPGIRRDELVHGATHLDVAPTVLAAFGLQKEDEMRGRVLFDALDAIPAVDPIPGPPAQAESTVPDPSSYLRDLGYSDPLSPSLTQLDASRSLHLAAAYLGSGQTARAIEPLEAAAALADDLARVLLAHAYLEVGRFSDCQRTLETITSESHRTFTLMIEGRLRLAQGRRHDALTLLAGARELAQSPALEALLGDVYRGLSRLAEAERCYRSALARDPYLPGAEIGLAALYLHQNRNEEAADAALRATGLDFGIAVAHYLLALASTRLRRHSTASTALQTCLQLAPEHPAASSLLRRLQC